MSDSSEWRGASKKVGSVLHPHGSLCADGFLPPAFQVHAGQHSSKHPK